MWEMIVGRKKPEFRNVEDARIQLKQQLSTQYKQTLMILDDVWSGAHLEELLFEAPGYKTVVTTRDNSAIPLNPCSQLYQLPLLAHKDALSLFCFSAFGQINSKCLETSIDFLDDVARECFLVLAIFPENKNISADALLSIWVYVWKLEWQDAFIMLLELASKNVFNLISSPGSEVTITYGDAPELYFSQHDIMQDLAIYGSQDSIVHRKRLFMPRQE